MSSPTEVQVITEMDVYEASVRKVMSNGNLNASPISAEPSYSWSDVETEEPTVQPKAEEPKAEEPKAEKPKVEEEPQLTESANERLDKLMAAISDIVHSDNIKVDVELESDEDMSELDDMPKLVDDTDSDMPELVSESDSDDEMPGLVEESDSENDDLMVAVFKRPSCPRCEAALKVLLAHEENDEEEELEEEHTYDEDATDSDTSAESSDDSDSDYVPSESESESPRTVRQLRRWNAETERAPESTPCVPPVIQFIAIILFVVHILKFLLNEPSQRIRCYS